MQSPQLPAALLLKIWISTGRYLASNTSRSYPDRILCHAPQW